MTVTAKWYFIEDSAKHVRQIVLSLPPESEVPSQVSSLLHGRTELMTQQWAGLTLFMSGDTPEKKGPFVFAKANNVVETLKGHEARVAFAFYRFRSGGILQIFVTVESPEVEAQAGYPYITENAHWAGLESKDSQELITTLLDRKNLDVCFIADGPVMPCQGYFGLRVAIPEECRTALKKEWETLKDYHSQIPESQKDYRAAMAQFENENPMDVNPVLDEE